MKKSILLFGLYIIILMNLAGQINAEEMQNLPEDEMRALPLCVTCPIGSAKFCSLCVTGAVVVGSLTIQDSITLCPGVTAPCCPGITGATGATGATGPQGPTGPTGIYTDAISWNTDETHYNVKNFQAATSGPTGITPQPFQPYFNGITGFRDTITGWPMTPAGETGTTPIVITAEFEVPEDLDPSVTPTVTLHWFNTTATGGNCTGSYINWQLTADYFSNLDLVPLSTGVPKYVLSSGDTLVDYSPGFTNLVQQQIDIPLTGPALVPGAYGQISATRVAPTGPGHTESNCDSYLTLMAFKYRKLRQ